MEQNWDIGSCVKKYKVGTSEMGFYIRPQEWGVIYFPALLWLLNVNLRLVQRGYGINGLYNASPLKHLLNRSRSILEQPYSEDGDGGAAICVCDILV